MNLTPTAACATAASLILAAHAAAQCPTGWLPGEAGSGTSLPVRSLAVYDPDGPGPAAPLLVAGGEFSSISGLTASRVGALEGDTPRPLGWMAQASPVDSLFVFDLDGAGPQPPSLLAGVDGTNICTWSGGDGLTGYWGRIFPSPPQVRAMFSFDFDGPGPEPETLVAAGGFTFIQNPEIMRHIARRDGTVWRPIGPGLEGGAVSALAAFDPDGPGPLPRQLIAAGAFTTSGSLPVPRIARWTGTEWFPLGGAIPNGEVLSLAVFDPDGPGPQGERLIAGGTFTFAGGVPAARVASWDGFVWSALGAGLGTSGASVNALTVFDFDGDGPETPSLIAGGQFFGVAGGDSRNVARWTGQSWAAMGTGLPNGVRAFAAYDPDADGPSPTRLYAGGSFNHHGDWMNPGADYIAWYDGSAWRRTGEGLNGGVSGVVAYDPDGEGPRAAEAIAGGFFERPFEGHRHGGARWDGATWRGTHAQYNLWSAADVTLADPDGVGPLPQQPAVVGRTYNLRWDGTKWWSFGPTSPNDQLPSRATAHDFDGPGGPLPPMLVVFCADGRVRRDLGNFQWGTLEGTFGGFPNVRMISHDPDGPGPAAPILVIANVYDYNGAPISGVAAWNGASWEQLGEGLRAETGTSFIHDLYRWDPDGPGPLTEQLLAAGNFTRSGSAVLDRVARWDGAAWLPFGPGLTQDVYALAAFDTDGPGPLPEQLIASQGHTISSINPFRPDDGLLRWTGQSWEFFAPVLGLVRGMLPFDADGPGPESATLFVWGSFGTLGNGPSALFGRWGPLATPAFTQHPAAATTLTAGAATFTAAAENADLVQWRHNGVPLTDGPRPSGAVVSGALTPTLTITAARAADGGLYDALATNACGGAASAQASLTVRCVGDWTGDGVINSADISSYLNYWIIGVQGGVSLQADVNADGVINSTDISVFLSAWLAAVTGGC